MKPQRKGPINVAHCPDCGGLHTVTRPQIRVSMSDVVLEGQLSLEDDE